MENSITIQIPEGFEIDKEKSTFEKIIFKKKVLDWPKNWEDLKELSGNYINKDSIIQTACECSTNAVNKNVVPTESLAKAILALCQLLQLRNYVWKNICNNYTFKPGNNAFVVATNNNNFIVYFIGEGNRILVFPTRLIAEKFLNQYKDLIEEAKELL